jgi:hypothetical protein
VPSEPGTPRLRTELALAIQTTALPTARRRAAYRAQLVAVGGAAPYTWKRAKGKLPKGLRLTRDGQVVGTAKVRTTKRVKLRVRDGAGVTTTRWVRIRVR